MSRTPWIAIICAGGLIAGCGSSTKAHTAPSGRSSTASTARASGPPMAKVGPAGAIGSRTSAGYRATNSGVLLAIKVALVRFFTAHGFSGVTVNCKAVHADGASCDVAGMNRSNQSSSNTITLSVNQSTGALRITRVAS